MWIAYILSIILTVAKAVGNMLESTKERIRNSLKENYRNGYVNPRKGVTLSDETKRSLYL